MARKRKTLPKEIQELLASGDVEELKRQFARCEPNALSVNQYGSNIFSLSPLPREFAFWAKEQGADVNFRDYYGSYPIFYQASAYQGDVQLLIDLGADVNAVGREGMTPLHNACLYGRLEAVNALLAAGAKADVRARGFHPDTPLELMLYQHRVPFENLWNITAVLLEHGASITPVARQAVASLGEQFQRVKRDSPNQEFLLQQAVWLNRLYQLFDLQPVAEIPFHDGVSPIVLTETESSAQFQKLWDYLVPSRGRAQTAQGEVIRIAGRIDDELMRNGGINWDRDYRSMLKAFPAYLKLGNPLSEAEIDRAEALVKRLWNGRTDEQACSELCACAVAWVVKNPKVLPPLPADYSR